MKKKQKIIELRTAAKLKVAELKTKIDFARSEAAKKRASVLTLRANVLKDMEANSTERLDAIAKYKAIMADVNAQLYADVAQIKAEIQQVKIECEKQCAAAEDDPETMGELPRQTVYCDGSEHSARIVARRLINKMPHIPKYGHLYVHVVMDTYCDSQEYYVSVLYGDRHNNETEIFSAQLHTAESEAAFVEKARRMFAEEPESGNSHVADPIASALGAVFGGNPVDQADNLISDTVKDGKEGKQ